MCDILKKEFRLKNIWFDHHKPEAFYTAQWRWHPAVYIAYRLVVACYSVACLLAIEIWSDSSKTLAYLTIWTYTVLCLYQLTALLGSVLGFVVGRNRKTATENCTLVNSGKFNGEQTSLSHQNLGYVENENISNGNVSTTSNGSAVEHGVILNTKSFRDTAIRWLYMKLTWCLADIVYVFGIIVTAIYFFALFPSIGITNGFIHDLNMHAFNSLQIIIDVAIVARPVRLLHIIYPLLYGACYLLFSVIFWLQDKKNNVLYPNVLDWNKPGTTIIYVILLAFVGLPLLQLLHFGIYRLRLSIKGRIEHTT